MDRAERIAVLEKDLDYALKQAHTWLDMSRRPSDEQRNNCSIGHCVDNHKLWMQHALRMQEMIERLSPFSAVPSPPPRKSRALRLDENDG